MPAAPLAGVSSTVLTETNLNADLGTAGTSQITAARSASISSSDTPPATSNSQAAMLSIIEPVSGITPEPRLPSTPTRPTNPTQATVTEAMIDPQLLGTVTSGTQSPTSLDSFVSMVQSLRGMAKYMSGCAWLVLTRAIILLLACITGLENELKAVQGNLGHRALLPPNSIPRPRGTASEDYNLQEAMGLKNDPVLYADAPNSPTRPKGDSRGPRGRGWGLRV